MKNKVSKIGRYVTIVTVGLFVVLVVLRITDVIAWSWWWVSAPVWVPFLLSLIMVVLFWGLVGYYARKVK